MSTCGLGRTLLRNVLPEQSPTEASFAARPLATQSLLLMSGSASLLSVSSFLLIQAMSQRLTSSQASACTQRGAPWPPSPSWRLLSIFGPRRTRAVGEESRRHGGPPPPPALGQPSRAARESAAFRRVRLHLHVWSRPLDSILDSNCATFGLTALPSVAGSFLVHRL